MKIVVKRMSVATIAVLVSVSIGLAGCQTMGNGAKIGAGIGGVAGCAAGAAIDKNNPGIGCMVGGLFGGVLGAIIGDAVEKKHEHEAVLAALRSGKRHTTGTFKNQSGHKVAFAVKPTKTYQSPSDSGLTCRDYEVTKTVDGAAAGTTTGSQCQVRVSDKPTFAEPES